jgi:hypothetical protein
VQLIAPLRSASLLLPHTASVTWNKVVLTLQDIEKPSLKSSNLTLSLEGVLYEIEAYPANGCSHSNEPLLTMDNEAAVS